MGEFMMRATRTAAPKHDLRLRSKPKWARNGPTATPHCWMR
jgi:hypothetical protein